MVLLNAPLCDFGWQAPDFKLKNIDGKYYSLSELNQSGGLLLMFICNHCPYVLAIIERLVQDCALLQKNNIGVAAIMSNDYSTYPEDSPEKMALFAQKHGFTFPYLLDDTQNTAKAYDAVCTPDFFGFNNKCELQYRGRIDNLKMNQAGEREAELLNAMLQIAQTGQGPENQKPSMGCSIKWL